MENKVLFNTRRLIITSALIILVTATTVTTVRADGNLLRGFDVPATTPEDQGHHTVLPSIYWPIGVTFDGTNLWYSQPCQCTRDIFLTTTNGVLLGDLHELDQAGALAWDGSHLWVASTLKNDQTCTPGVTGCAFISELDVSTGNTIKTVDLSAIFAVDQMCGFIDGLSYDSATGTFWVSPDIGCASSFVSNPCTIGFVYNVDQNGNLIQRLQLPFAVAGDAKVGNFLYLVTCGSRGTLRPINKTTLNGTLVSSFLTVSVSGFHESAESVAFDPTTFAPNCALWVVQDYNIPFDASLAAYQIDCP